MKKDRDTPMTPRSPKRTILVLTGMFYLACLFFTLNLNLDEKITSMLPDSDPEVADFKYIISHVPAAETLYIQVETKTHDPDTLKKAGDAFYSAIAASPFFTNLVYQFSHESVMNLLEFVNQNKYWLFDDMDLKEIDKRFSKENIRQLLPRIKRQLLEPGATFSTDRIIKDPFGLDNIILGKLKKFQAEASGIHISGSRIISQDETHLLIMAAPAFPAVDTRQSAQMFAFLNQEKARVTQAFDSQIHIGFSGNHVATLDNSTTIQADVKSAIIAMTAGILVIGFFFFSRFLYVILIFIPTLVSLTFASALFSFYTQEVSAIALGCGAVLIGITVDFGIHILFSVDTLGIARTDEIISRLKKPIATGAATTMAAFGCLLFSSLPGQRQMGFFTIFGILGAAIFAVFVLKYFILFLPQTPKKPLISLVNGCDRLMAFRKKHLLWISLVCILAFGVSLIGLKAFRFDGDVAALNHLTPDTQRDMDDFLSTWGKTAPSLILVTAKTLEQTLEKNDELFRLLKQLEEQKLVDQIASLSDIFPSRVHRKKQYENFQTFLPAQRIDALERQLSAACLANGFSTTAFAPFFKGLRAPKKPFDRRDFGPTIIDPLIKTKLIFQKNSVLALTTLNVTDNRIPEIIARIKTELPQARFLDRRHLVEKITSLVAREFKHLFLFAAGAMVLTLFLFLGRIRIVLITMLPVFLSAVMTAGIMGLARIPVNLISILFIVFVFGVGVDFSIFLVHHELNKNPGTRQVTAGAVIICAMTTIGAFTCLAFARHHALSSIGVAGLTGMLTSLLLSLVLIPVVMEKWGWHKCH